VLSRLIVETGAQLPLGVRPQIRVFAPFRCQLPVIFYRVPAREALAVLLAEDVAQIFDFHTQTLDILYCATILCQLVPSINITQDQVILVVHFRVLACGCVRDTAVKTLRVDLLRWHASGHDWTRRVIIRATSARVPHAEIV
jgi:hypothetical protein